MVFIIGDIWRTDTLVRRADAAILVDFSLHVPLPLINLVLFEAKALLQLYDFGLGPLGVLLELKKQDLILLFIFA